MKKTISTGLFLAASFLLLSGFHGGCRSHSPEERAKRMTRYAHAHADDFLDDVDATDEQRAKVHASVDRTLETVKPMIAEHQKVKNELIDEWKSAKPNRERVHQIVDGRVEALRSVLHQLADSVIELHEILTPEQRSELDDRVERARH